MDNGESFLITETFDVLEFWDTCKILLDLSQLSAVGANQIIMFIKKKSILKINFNIIESKNLLRTFKKLISIYKLYTKKKGIRFS